MNLSSGLELELFWGSEDNRANLALSKWFLVVFFFFLVYLHVQAQ